MTKASALAPSTCHRWAFLCLISGALLQLPEVVQGLGPTGGQGSQHPETSAWCQPKLSLGKEEIPLMKVTLPQPLLVINKGTCGAVCRMSPHRILGPSFGQEPRAKRRGTGSLTGTSGRETCKEWGWRGVVKPRRERPETKGETNRAGRCKRETGTRNRERATG